VASLRERLSRALKKDEGGGLSPEDISLLKEALETQLRKEPFNESLGRTVRRRVEGDEKGYETYVRIIGVVRESARKRDVELEKAAAQLCGD